MIELPLSRGLVALVDDEDRWTRDFKWSAAKRAGRWYAVRRCKSTEPRAGRVVYLHRELLGDPSGALVDHRNGDGLDCRRRNIRVVDPATNSRNSKPRSTDGCGHKGVHVDKRGRWNANITIRGQRTNLGYFSTQDEAVVARARAEVAVLGVEPQRAEDISTALAMSVDPVRRRHPQWNPTTQHAPLPF